MFPLGHVGIGTHLIPRRLREGLPWRWLALGCLLPDLIDKPIWIGAQALGVESRLFDTARMIGHTAFLLAAVAAVAGAGVRDSDAPGARCFDRQGDGRRVGRVEELAVLAV